MSGQGDAPPWGGLLRGRVASESDVPESHEREEVDPLEAFAFSTGEGVFGGCGGASHLASLRVG